MKVSGDADTSTISLDDVASMTPTIAASTRTNVVVGAIVAAALALML